MSLAVRNEAADPVHDQSAPPPARIEAARAVANVLRDIIRQQNLSVKISGREYVRCEGWVALGALMGLLPREVSVRRIDDPRGYEATVEVIRVSDGAVLSRASAICSRDEPLWADRPEYAVRSMAVTRATGKAFRLIYSWVMALAGYEPTPAEEMDGVVVVEAKPVETKPTRPVNNHRPQPKPQAKRRMTDAQRALASAVVDAVARAYPDLPPKSDEFKSRCQALLHAFTNISRPEEVPDDMARAKTNEIRDLAPDVVKSYVEVPF